MSAISSGLSNPGERLKLTAEVGPMQTGTGCGGYYQRYYAVRTSERRDLAKQPNEYVVHVLERPPGESA